MSRNLGFSIENLAEQLFAACQRTKLIDTPDFGKAAVRVKASLYDADLKGLNLDSKPGFTWQQEAVVEAFKYFRRAQRAVQNPDAFGDTFEDAHVQAMVRALGSINPSC